MTTAKALPNNTAWASDVDTHYPALKRELKRAGCFEPVPWTNLRDMILVRLKLFVTEVAVWLLHTGGQSVLAEGNVIVVPGHSLFVADACAGLTSIVTMLPLACIAAYFLSHGVWRRGLVVASVIPVAVAANILRVVVTVWMVPTWGAEAAQGALHESFGLVTYAIGIGSLLIVARIVR